MALEQASERIMIKATPQRCYEVASDFAAYTDWARDIKKVEIVGNDSEGRPSTVTYTAEALGRSTTVTVIYDYSKAPTELSWKLVEGDLEKQWEGRFVFASINDETEVTYEVAIDLSVPMPGFLKRRVESRIMQTLNTDLKARAEDN